MAELRDQLSEQIHLLGDLLGVTLIEQEGQEMFDLVESIRALAKAGRAGDQTADQELLDLIQSLPVALARAVVKAFAGYFQLASLAEEQARVRVLRQRARSTQKSGEPVDESMAEAIGLLKQKGLGHEEMQQLLDGLFIMPVFTAHPTEAKRRTVLAKLDRIGATLNRLDLGALR
jgi:phosphoenolpyruvate carboxylase